MSFIKTNKRYYGVPSLNSAKNILSFCLTGDSEVTIPFTVALSSGDNMFPGESWGSGVDVGVAFNVGVGVVLDFLTLPEEENSSDRLLAMVSVKMGRNKHVLKRQG